MGERHKLALVAAALRALTAKKKTWVGRQAGIVVAGYRSSEALSSRTASSKAGPSRVRARQAMLVVLPVPGGP